MQPVTRSIKRKLESVSSQKTQKKTCFVQDKCAIKLAICSSMASSRGSRQVLLPFQCWDRGILPLCLMKNFTNSALKRFGTYKLTRQNEILLNSLFNECVWIFSEDAKNILNMLQVRIIFDWMKKNYNKMIFGLKK